MGKYPYPVHGWDAVRLYENLTPLQLTELMGALKDDPANVNPTAVIGSINLYTKAARKRMDAVAWAIRYHIRDRTAA